MIGRTSSAVYCPSDVVVLSTNVNQFTNRHLLTYLKKVRQNGAFAMALVRSERCRV